MKKKNDALGVGASAKVYRAVEKSTKAVRAVKVIDMKKLSTNERKALDQEVGIMRLLDHPHIIKLFEVFEDASKLYLVMELCSGGELFDRIKKSVDEKQQGFDEYHAADVMKQILLAMSYMHHKHICHRDIKPENFVLKDDSEDALLKVIDFGIAAKIKPGGKLLSKVGTIAYIAPEVIAGQYNHKVDIWACGVVLYILLTGLPPFYIEENPRKFKRPKDAENAMLKKIRNADKAFFEKQMAQDPWRCVSKEAKQLVVRMLDPSSKSRPEAADILNDVWLKKAFQTTGRSPLDDRTIARFRAFHDSSKLKRICLTLIATQLEEKDISKLRSQFEALDTNGDGTLSREELKMGLETMNMSAEDFEALMEIDSDGSGEIEWTEFIAAAMDFHRIKKTEMLRDVFNKFDADGDGSISQTELTTYLTQGTDLIISDEQAKKLIEDADQNGDGEIDFDEFVTMMTDQSWPGSPDAQSTKSDKSKRKVLFGREVAEIN
jgi:calcium-dependent protein kinase